MCQQGSQVKFFSSNLPTTADLKKALTFPNPIGFSLLHIGDFIYNIPVYNGTEFTKSAEYTGQDGYSIKTAFWDGGVPENTNANIKHYIFAETYKEFNPVLDSELLEIDNYDNLTHTNVKFSSIIDKMSLGIKSLLKVDFKFQSLNDSGPKNLLSFFPFPHLQPIKKPSWFMGSFYFIQFYPSEQVLRGLIVLYLLTLFIGYVLST